ncbi:hypothetical protein Y032_0076g1045 [Ancylostoma ceylanicum]|nr:hypothetical protein Y032_0076g1045 [Ancylostoma ceylanicum]
MAAYFLLKRRNAADTNSVFVLHFCEISQARKLFQMSPDAIADIIRAVVLLFDVMTVRKFGFLVFHGNDVDSVEFHQSWKSTLAIFDFLVF